MKNVDTRIQYTKHALQTALLEILREKPIAAVSVRELCDAAGLNRGTFYLHYSVPNDVLREIENQFIQENFGHFSPYLQGKHELNYLTMLFASVLRNREMCMVLMGNHGAPQFVDRLKDMMHDNVLADWKRDFPTYAASDLEFVYDFVFYGSMRIILKWLKAEGGLTTEDLGKRLDRLGHYCHLAIREFAGQRESG